MPILSAMLMILDIAGHDILISNRGVKMNVDERKVVVITIQINEESLNIGKENNWGRSRGLHT